VPGFYHHLIAQGGNIVNNCQHKVRYCP